MDPEIAEAVLLEHFRQPRHQQSCAEDQTTVNTARGDNPLCGDIVKVEAVLQDEQAPCGCLSFSGQGCALSQAGTSITLSVFADKTVSELRELLPRLVEDLEAGNATAWDHGAEELLALFFAAAENPARIRCAALGAETLLAALGAIE